MIRKVFLILNLSIMLLSCGGARKGPSSDMVTVDLDLTKAIDDTSPIVDPEDNLGAYGPVSNEITYQSNSNDNISVGILIGPSLYNSIESMRVLKCMEKTGQKVNVVIGVGFASLIGSLYAQGESLEIIKWKLFKELRENKEVPYSYDWSQRWFNFALANIDENKIKLSERSLWFYDNESEKGFVAKGDFKEKLRENLFVNKDDFSLKHNFLNVEQLKSLPAQKLLIINTLPEKIRLKKNDDYLFGLFSKIHSFFKKLNGSDIIVINIKTKSTIDDQKVNDSQIVDERFCTEIANYIR